MLSEAMRAIAKCERVRGAVLGLDEKAVGTSSDYGIPRAVAGHEMVLASPLALESLRARVSTVPHVSTVRSDRRTS